MSTIEVNQKRTKSSALKLAEFLLIAEAFINSYSFCQLQWNKNNNAIQNKVYTNSIKRNKLLAQPQLSSEDLVLHQTARFFLYLISIFILLTHRKVTEALIHRVGNYPDLLLEMPRYFCPLAI